jgi:hypothetical protein
MPWPAWAGWISWPFSVLSGAALLVDLCAAFLIFGGGYCSLQCFCKLCTELANFAEIETGELVRVE